MDDGIFTKVGITVKAKYGKSLKIFTKPGEQGDKVKIKTARSKWKFLSLMTYVSDDFSPD